MKNQTNTGSSCFSPFLLWTIYMRLKYLPVHRLRRYVVCSTVLLGVLYVVFGFSATFSASGTAWLTWTGSFQESLPRLFNLLDTTAVNGTSWKISNRPFHHTVSVNPDDYLALRAKLHHHDPRISLAAASHYLAVNGDLQLPFSWQDWIDLAPLNPYLQGEKPSCAQFLSQGLDFPNGHTTPMTDKEMYCLDDEKFLQSSRGQFHDPSLLPGFNFQLWMSAKKTFVEKFIFAKSLALSGLDPPLNMFFLTDHDGYIQVKTVEAKSMTQTGLLRDYFNSLDAAQDGSVDVDPLIHFEEFAQSTKHHSFTKPGTQLELSLNDFVLDLNYHPKTPEFKESIEFSQLTSPNTAPKYFHEVNINFPTTYRGHKLVEDGGHYDYRFFNGFTTEIPESIFKPHSPEFPPDQYKYPENGNDNPQFAYDSSEKRKAIILSNMIHTLLTLAHESNRRIILGHGSLLAWYFNGLSFPWDNDADVQMPINQLLSFCDNFNQSMVLQNPRYGFGKYFLDCSSFLTHRKKYNGNNNIDARFVDIDSGMFVDITGLAVSSEMLRKPDWSKMTPVLPQGLFNDYPTPKAAKLPPRKNIGHLKDIDPEADKAYANGQRPDLSDDLDEKIPKVEPSRSVEQDLFDFHLKHGIVNCRNRHFYVVDKMKSIKLTKFENGPVWVPNDFHYLERILSDEYSPKSMQSQSQDSFLYSKELKMWVPAASVFMGCRDQALEKSSVTDISRVLDNGKAPTVTRKSRKKRTLLGSHVQKCFNNDPDGVLKKMVDIGISNLLDDREFTQAELASQLAEAKVKLPKSNKIQYLNVVQELFTIKDAAAFHQVEMNEMNTKWQWNDNSYTYNQPFDAEARFPPLRTSMLDYLTEMDRSNKN